MAANLILVRLIGTGECVELPSTTPVVFIRDVQEADREIVIIGAFGSHAVDALLWRTTRSFEPAYVSETDERWHLAEFVDANVPTEPAPVPDTWSTFGEVSFLGEGES